MEKVKRANLIGGVSGLVAFIGLVFLFIGGFSFPANGLPGFLDWYKPFGALIGNKGETILAIIMTWVLLIGLLGILGGSIMQLMSMSEAGEEKTMTMIAGVLGILAVIVFLIVGIFVNAAMGWLFYVLIVFIIGSTVTSILGYINAK